jgi:hypothetical protein
MAGSVRHLLLPVRVIGRSGAALPDAFDDPDTLGFVALLGSQGRSRPSPWPIGSKRTPRSS